MIAQRRCSRDFLVLNGPEYVELMIPTKLKKRKWMSLCKDAHVQTDSNMFCDLQAHRHESVYRTTRDIWKWQLSPKARMDGQMTTR